MSRRPHVGGGAGQLPHRRHRVRKQNPAFINAPAVEGKHSPVSRRTITRELQSPGEARLLDRLAVYRARKVIDHSVKLEETVEILRLFVAGTLKSPKRLRSQLLGQQK